MFSSLPQRWRRLPRYRGMLVIMLWQVPVVPEIRPDGSIGFMVGGGTDRLFHIGCEGNVISSEPFNYRQAGVEFDYDVGRGVRIDAAAGHIGSDMHVQQGGFFGARVRRDTPRFGTGLGLAHAPGELGSKEMIALHLRIGAAERLHFRMDINEPGALMTQQAARFGVGSNATRRDRVSAFGGLALLGSEHQVWGVAAEVTAPRSQRFAARAIGHAGARDGHSVYGFALGARYLIP